MVKQRQNGLYYGALLVVVFVWGMDPTVNSYFYRAYSAAVLSAISTFASAVLFLILSIKRLKELDRSYLKIALPISLLNALACLLQRIGLQYTTPANYAFLEHLSCAVVPIALYLMVRKKPDGWQIFSCILCLAGCFILSGMGSLSFGVGDFLCSLAGIMLGISVAATGVYAGRLDLRLYMMIYMSMYFLTSLIMAFSLDATGIEKAVFSRTPWLLLGAVLFGLLSVGLCWLLKTVAMTHLDPTAVAVISPFSAVIAGVVSVICGLDRLTWNLLLGAALILAALLLSGLNDVRRAKDIDWD